MKKWEKEVYRFGISVINCYFCHKLQNVNRESPKYYVNEKNIFFSKCRK